MRTDGVPRLRRAGLAAALGVLAAGAALAGCGDTVTGTAREDAAEASAYRSEAAASSAAATSAKRVADARKAKADNCGAFLQRTDHAIDVFNAFVDASNARGTDIEAKRGAATTELRKSADAVDGGVRDAGPALDPDLAAKLGDYVGAARALADESERMQDSVQAVNQAKDRFNGSLDAVRAACG